MKRRIYLITLLSFAAIGMYAQSPHGEKFNADCSICHSPSNWEMVPNSAFEHDTTGFALTGQHTDTECRQCHVALDFSKAGTECVSCHTDMHNNTVGQQCDYCHNTGSWIVQDISKIHNMSRFPLTGAHNVTDCYLCHPSASLFRFEPLGVQCYDCHRQDYLATTMPNHTEVGYSTQCDDCHSLHATEWLATGFEHGFFPLIGGHANVDCFSCHGDEPYGKIEADCYYCHETAYETTTSPNHRALGFGTNCNECHSLSPGWSPARYTSHDRESFPIYSGTHSGEWDACTDCHKQPSNYANFTCIDCHHHNKSDTDRKHKGRRNYVYESSACYDCHPRGKGD